MRHRTNSEIKAYVDGYTACFNQYSECLKNRKSVLDSKKKMEIYLAAVTGVLEATGNATNADRIRNMSNKELATIMSRPCPNSTPKNVCLEVPGVATPENCQRCWLSWLGEDPADGNDL